ncbi:alcohol dehydrogenase [Lasiodiplodia theobromae]|uniref:alcohol dehydrogenase n=1 Tax=Lasiodiplodia theobromae TaxID=45133 RepID=UPI0015C31A7B|nr:alcohol dehydrogenase [Lasiodiplodia theobromae]KAF4537156.1 alcohol dehydrogenase [Lasiodiplodia theobromae]
MTMRDEYPIHTLGLIGCGKLGSALLQGLLLAPPPPTLQHIHITVRTPSSAAHIHSTFLSSPSTTTPIPVTLNTADPLTTCLAADAVILACKPTQHAAILGTPGIAAALAGKPLISLLGGVTEEQLAASLALSPPLSSPSSSSSASSPPSAAAIIVRAMPNAAAAVRRSTTLLASSAFAPAPAASGNGGTAMMKDAIVRLFATLGSSTAPRVVSPSTLEAAAVVAASGPAFFARVVGAVADELHGLLLAEQTGGAEDANEAELALQLAAGAMGGAAALVERGGWSAEEVERRVASVGGSTEKGLGVLGERGVGEAMGEAVRVTFEAARGLGGSGGGVEGRSEVVVDEVMEMPADGMMKAVVLKKERQVVLERRPIPVIEGPGEVLVKVEYSGLCGSDLHLYRGTEDCGSDFILGHEFTGRVVQAGKDVKKVAMGDRVVAAFTTSCAQCFYCKAGLSARCTSCMVFGTPKLGGAQSQYVRVPLADTTLTKAPVNVHPRNLILMADIFPTGFFAARNAFSRLTRQQARTATVAVIGCGPVGLCALAATTSTHQPAHLLAIDAVPSRLQNAASLGAEPFNYQIQRQELDSRIRELTQGRGVDVVLELVGAKAALGMAFDLVRPGGTISSVGVHSSEFPFTATQAYDKNVTLHMGRCPVASVFPEALECLEKVQEKLGCLTETVVPLSEAVAYYDVFNRMEVQKVIFDAEK